MARFCLNRNALTNFSLAIALGDIVQHGRERAIANFADCIRFGVIPIQIMFATDKFFVGARHQSYLSTEAKSYIRRVLYKNPRPHPLTPSPSGRRGIESLAPLSLRERQGGFIQRKKNDNTYWEAIAN